MRISSCMTTITSLPLLILLAATTTIVIVCSENLPNSPSSPIDNNVSSPAIVATPGIIDEASLAFKQAEEVLKRPLISSSELNVAIEKLEHALSLGHSMAVMELARLFFFGRDNLQPDYDRCVTYLDRCEEPECLFLLGLFHSNALGGKVRSMAHALAYYGVAAERMNGPSRMALGWVYGDGKTVPKSCIKSRDYYYPVAAETAEKFERERTRNFPKQSKLSYEKSEGGGNSQSPRDVVDFYQYNSDSSDASSVFFLGQVFYLGVGGVDRDYNQARHYFGQAAKLGHSGAIGYLGQMDFYGEGSTDNKPDYRRAYHNFRKAAKEKNPIGLMGMGLLYWRGIEVVADREEALRYFKQAAELENAEASYYMGKVLQEIDPITHDDRIFSAYIVALRGGYALAGFELAKMNMEKEITCGLAKYLLVNILEKQPSMAMIEEGNSLFQAGHMAAALSRYLYLAEQGSEVAQYNAAFLLEHLARRTKDDTLRRRAIIWWSNSADQGNVDAMLMMGDYFYYGYGIDQPSRITAAAYYHRAIDKKSAQAAFNLAYLHQYGLGVPQDYNMARRYYEQAISLGRAGEIPEAWLPAFLAIRYLSISQRFLATRKVISRFSSLKFSMVTAIAFGLATLFLAIYHFGLGQRRPILRNLTGSNDSLGEVSFSALSEEERNFLPPLSSSSSPSTSTTTTTALRPKPEEKEEPLIIQSEGVLNSTVQNK